MPEFLSIADFAEKAGVTKQAIYKRLEKDLAAYLSMQDGKKVISSDALSLFSRQEPAEATGSQLSEVLSMLKAEQEKNGKLQDEIVRLSFELSEIAQKSQILTDQAQQLHALGTAVDRTEDKPLPEPKKKKSFFDRFR